MPIFVWTALCTNIVPINRNLVEEKTRMLKHVRMLDEIEEWCSTELKGEYLVSYESASFRKDYDKPYQIVFESETDAILFKMRWF